ncbi:hypothetical protein RirG_021400 [Rhizophagus irregularis DAOM 197198w]|uniref:Uncharacterized protein n=1 Tax=Rhizophagus irregularis (strain DAOM 197198w) TaxID=1432141 RepID=A0A015K7M6_RHIIW|nr:hypothetical protein RirG_021400 [Rhizophagus irregularis DAOM 197198w]EXX77707.1 hypothetical protein RirG_021400 [Rhizophagus irregularis DAOM 197198w]
MFLEVIRINLKHLCNQGKEINEKSALPENASESGKAELLKQVAEERTKHEVENAELKSRIEELEKGRTDTVAENGGSGDDNEENKQEI